MKKRFSTMFMIALTCMLAIAGCSNNGGNNGNEGNNGMNTSTNTPQQTATATDKADLRITWWGSQPRHDVTSQVLNMYTEKNAGITFSPEYQGFDGYFQKMTLLAASNNMPDVLQFYVGSGDTDQFLAKGLIAPLDEFIESGAMDVSDISEGVLSGGRAADGKLYGVPLGINAKAMLIDVGIYEQAGLEVPGNGYESWEALHDDLVILKEVTGAYGADDLFDVNFLFPYYARQFEQTQYSQETGIGFDEKVYTDFFSMKKQWTDEGLIPSPDMTMTIKSPEESFIVKGQSAVSTVYTNQYSSVAKAAGRTLQLIPLPGPNAEKAIDLRPSSHFSISTNSTNKEAAAKFISYFVNDIEANLVLNAERGMPIAGKVRDALTEGFDPEQKAAADYISKIAENSGPLDPQAPAGSTEIENLMRDLEQQILYDQISVQEGFEKLNSGVAEIIAKNK